MKKKKVMKLVEFDNSSFDRIYSSLFLFEIIRSLRFEN